LPRRFRANEQAKEINDGGRMVSEGTQTAPKTNVRNPRRGPIQIIDPHQLGAKSLATRASRVVFREEERRTSKIRQMKEDDHAKKPRVAIR